MAAGLLQFSLGLNTGQFLTALTGAQRALARWTGISLSVGGAVAAVWRTISRGAELSDLSARTGETAGNLLKLQRGFEQAGVSAQAVPRVLYMVQRALGGTNEQGEKVSDLFGELGLNLEELRRRSAGEAFQSILGAMAQMDRARAAFVSGKLFGRFGGQDILQLAHGARDFALGVESAAAAAARFDRSAGLMDAFKDAMQRLRWELEDALIGPASAAAKFGLALVLSIKQARLPELLSAAMATGLEAWFAWLRGLPKQLAALLADTAQEAAPSFGKALALGVVRYHATLAEFWKGVFPAGSFAEKIANGISERLAELEIKARKKWGLDIAGGGLGWLRGAISGPAGETKEREAFAKLVDEIVGPFLQHQPGGLPPPPELESGRTGRGLGRSIQATELERIGAIFPGGWQDRTAREMAQYQRRIAQSTAATAAILRKIEAKRMLDWANQ